MILATIKDTANHVRKRICSDATKKVAEMFKFPRKERKQGKEEETRERKDEGRKEKERTRERKCKSMAWYSKSPRIRTYFFERQAEIGSNFKGTKTNFRV